MEKLEIRIFEAVIKHKINLRPYASTGFWLCPLLPGAIILSAFKHPVEASSTYKQSAVVSLGLVLTTLLFLIQCLRRKDITKIRSILLIPSAVVATIFYTEYNKGFLLSFINGMLSGICAHKLFIFIIKKCRRCFTVGEAMVVSQALILFIHASICNILKTINNVPYKTADISSTFVTIALLCILIVCILTYNLISLRKMLPFYFMFGITVLVAYLSLFILIRFNPITWLLMFILKDMQRIQLLMYWSFCTVLATIIIKKQVSSAKKASTIVRKTFHILAVVVYIPGLLYECSLLYLASILVFVIFFLLELLRVLKVPPMGQFLEDSFMVFADEKDSMLALTPIYLLSGCSLPLWIHPAPCDISDSIGFYVLPLISGLLSVGVGDTAASLFGTILGSHKWPGTKKTVEGTLGCILSQVFVVFLLVYSGVILRGHQQIIKAGIAIVSISLIEARTSQVDNLALPLIMYIILI